MTQKRKGKLKMIMNRLWSAVRPQGHKRQRISMSIDLDRFQKLKTERETKQRR